MLATTEQWSMSLNTSYILCRSRLYTIWKAYFQKLFGPVAEREWFTGESWTKSMLWSVGIIARPTNRYVKI